MRGRNPGAGSSLAHDEDGLSDIVGSILLVAITVVMAAAFALLLFQFKGPQPEPVVAVAVTANPGSGGWGTGDEALRLTHNGGEALLASQTTIVYSVTTGGSTVVTTLTGATQLGGAFCSPTCAADGKLSIGEVWTRTTTLLATDTVVMNVINKQSATNLVATASLVPGQLPTGQTCVFDTSPPTVAAWNQTPSDIQSTTVGAITVTATLTDDCLGVDQTAPSQIFWCLTSAPPCTSAAMAGVTTTRIATNQWRGTVPSQTWPTKVGQTLEYEVRVMKDTAGHSGTSVRNTDLVDVVTVFNYVNTNTATTGTVTNFANAQSASDSSAVATLTEGGSSAEVTATLAATGTISSTGWTTPNNGFASDNVYATATTDAVTVRYSLADQAGSPGTITQVVLKLEQSVSLAWVNDQWTLQACFNSGYLAGACSTASGGLNGATLDTVLTYDVTSLRPGGGSWSWTDINNLELLAKTSKVGGIDGTWRVDLASVTVTSATTYSTDIKFDWTGVPAGTIGTHTLQLNYLTTGDTYNVMVWNWVTSTYTNRGTLSAATLTPFTYLLTAQEYSSGNVRVQFTDVTPTGTTQGTLGIEYARVATT